MIDYLVVDYSLLGQHPSRLVFFVPSVHVELELGQAGVEAALGDQLCVGALGDDAATASTSPTPTATNWLCGVRPERFSIEGTIMIEEHLSS